MPTPALTPEIIAAHERLYPRLAALLKQVERVAARRPGAEVTEETGRLARELCREAAKLLGRDGRGIGLPKPVAGAPLDHGGLAIHLGQALAGLEQFEATHSGHSKQLGYAIWQVDGPPMPVTRLLPRGGKAIEPRDPKTNFFRREVTRLILARYSAGYDTGYKDASEGRPPSAEYAERLWDSEREREAGVAAAQRAGIPRPRVRYTNPPRALVPKGAVLTDPKERQRRW